MTWQCIKYSKSHIQLKREVGLAIYTRKQTITAVVNQCQTTKSVLTGKVLSYWEKMHSVGGSSRW